MNPMFCFLQNYKILSYGGSCPQISLLQRIYRLCTIMNIKNTKKRPSNTYSPIFTSFLKISYSISSYSALCLASISKSFLSRASLIIADNSFLRLISFLAPIRANGADTTTTHMDIIIVNKGLNNPHKYTMGITNPKQKSASVISITMIMFCSSLKYSSPGRTTRCRSEPSNHVLEQS